VARATTTTAAAIARLVPTTAASSTGCDPNYSGACVPIGPDVDCPDIPVKNFRVVGRDIDRLDADKDGIACES
jgi:hypothetical protein